MGSIRLYLSAIPTTTLLTPDKILPHHAYI
jgi:hypothetical protein